MKFNRIIQKLKRKLNDSKGMALLATLIFTVVISTLGIALLTMTNNDTKLTTLQKESSEAFYSADSGINRAINWLERKPSPPPASAINAIDFLNGEKWVDIEGNEYPVDATLNPGEYYKIEMSLPVTVNFLQSYKIISTGKLVGPNRNATRVIEKLVDITSFAEYAYFANSGATNLWFADGSIVDGRLHTNEKLRILGNPTFKGLATAVDGIVWGNDEPTGDEKDKIFLEGYRVGPAEYIKLPDKVGDISGTGNPLSLESIAMGSGIPTGNGVYVPHDVSDNITGGIYVEGNLDELHLTTVNTTVNSLSVINFRQGSTYTTITTLPAGSIDPYDSTPVTSDKTVIKKSTDPSPSYCDGLTNGLLYVNGEIESLEAPESEGGHQGKLTIVATEDITITDDIKYKTLIDHPEIDIHTDNPEELLPITDTLGIISSGDVVLKIPSDNPNPIVCSTIMALGESLTNYYSSRRPVGNFTLFGGLIHMRDAIMGYSDWNGNIIRGYIEDYTFDERNNDPTSDSIPPYFPTTGNYEPIYWMESNG